MTECELSDWWRNEVASWDQDVFHRIAPTRLIAGWGIGLIAATTSILFAFLWIQPTLSKPQAVVLVPASIAPSASKRKVLTLLDEFLAADSVESKARFVRERHRVEPLMHEYYKSVELPVLTSDEYRIVEHFSNPLVADGLEVITVSSDQLGQASFPIVSVDGGLLVDWEATVAHASTSWSSFLSREHHDSTATFRLFGTSLSFDPAPLSADEYDLYRLTSPHSEFVSYAVCRKESDGGRFLRESMERAVRSGNTPLALTLNVKLITPLAEHSVAVVEIIDFLADGWVMETKRPD